MEDAFPILRKDSIRHWRHRTMAMVNIIVQEGEHVYISKVEIPDGATFQGMELRLKGSMGQGLKSFLPRERMHYLAKEQAVIFSDAIAKLISALR
jgi:hypothetical protein